MHRGVFIEKYFKDENIVMFVSERGYISYFLLVFPFGVDPKHPNKGLLRQL